MKFQLPDVSGLPASLQPTSQSAPDKLLSAATLTNVARVAIARLPEQILRISMPGTEKTIPLEIRLPSSGAIKDNAPTYIAQTASPDKSRPMAVLLQALEQRSQQPLTTKTEAGVSQYITRLVQAQPETAITLSARIVSASSNSLTIKPDGSANQAAISLPAKDASVSFKSNDAVTLTVKASPKGGFDITITPKNAASPSPVAIALKSTKAANEAIHAIVSAKLSQTGMTIKQPESLPVPKQLESIFPAPGRQPQATQPIEKILSMKVEGGAKEVPQIITRQTYLQPVVKSPVPHDLNQQIRIPVLARHLMSSSTVASLPQAQLLPLPLQPPPASGGKPLPEQTALQSSGATEKQAASSNKADTVQNTLSPEAQTKLHAQIIELSRVLLKDTGSTKDALSQLVQILRSGQANSGTQTRQTLNRLLSAIQGTDPKPMKPDALQNAEPSGATEAGKTSQPSLSQQLQSLISSPALTLTPAQLTTPAPANNLVAGLVMLLQLTLAGRAINRQPALAAQADAPEQMLQKVVPQTGTGSSPSRVSQDLASLESRSQFLNQVKTLLANHQQQKLSQADSRLQGQDSLYYILPVTSQKGAPPEILIRPDERGGGQAGSSGSKRKLWNVTMKLDVGELGELLAKSRIDGEVIELDLYTSTDALLHRVADTLPLLKRRLTALGLEVAQSSFQRGKIPSTLNDRPYHIFETQA